MRVLFVPRADPDAGTTVLALDPLGARGETEVGHGSEGDLVAFGGPYRQVAQLGDGLVGALVEGQAHLALAPGGAEALQAPAAEGQRDDLGRLVERDAVAGRELAVELAVVV